MRALINLSISMTLIALCVAGCGGGSGGSGSSLAGGGGSSSSSSSSSGSCVASGTNTGSSNVATVVVDGGPTCAYYQGQGQANILYVTVVVCAPGSTTNCQAIDHVQVDTGSYGLRVIYQALQPSLAAALPIVDESVSGQALAECTQFADGYSWGPIRSADMQIAGEKTSALEIQVVGDPAYANVPNACSSYGTQEDTVAAFGANGIIGVGPFVQDCGGGPQSCTTVANNGSYYVCASSSATCTASTVSLAQQVSNPVAFFPTDNNGVLIELPALAAGGEASVTGSMIFGVDTETNNAMTATNVLPADPSNGNISTVFNGQSFVDNSYIDSGSNAYYFNDSSLTQCSTSSNPGFYCPASETTLSATIEGYQGTPSSNVTFYVGNVDNFNGAYAAFDDLAGCPVSASGSGTACSTAPTSAFDWGLPFFYGLNLYTVIDCSPSVGASCSTTSKGYGPYIAY